MRSVTKIIPTLRFNQNGQVISNDHSENDSSNENEESNSPQPINKVYYIANENGNIASYNPNYILRKLADGRQYKIYLPDHGGEMALVEDVGDEYVKKEDIRNALLEAVSQDIPDSYTVEDIVNSHNRLLQALRDLIS